MGTRDHPFETGFDLTLRAERLEQPLRWRTPRMIFVNSMSDLFHKEIPKEFIARVFDTMEAASWHTFQVLTKRSSLMRNNFCASGTERSAHLSMFGSAFLSRTVRRNRASGICAKRPLASGSSIEPLIGPVGKLDLAGIDWVIVGGESGPGARPMKEEWAVDVRDQCQASNVAFFFKQWGGRSPKSATSRGGGMEPISRGSSAAQPACVSGYLVTSSRDIQFDEIGRWSELKLEIVEKYGAARRFSHDRIYKNGFWLQLFASSTLMGILSRHMLMDRSAKPGRFDEIF